MNEASNQNIAQFAFEQVASIGDYKQEFRSLARSFPSMLQKHGLGTAVAFLCAKEENAHKYLCRCIDAWLNQEFAKETKSQVEGHATIQKDLMEKIVAADRVTYRMYMDSTMNLCLWIKRFAEGMKEGGEKSDHVKSEGK